MDKYENIYDFIVNEEASYKTLRVPITTSKDWNMHEHIERCTNVAHGWFHKGQNDDTRPYTDIVSPILNVAIRSEGFDVKDIVPYVNDAEKYYKSFLVKKYHPQWARRNELDTFIDELVESSVVYDLALIKNVNSERPEVVPLQMIAFCDQTNVLGGPLGLKHQYSESELLEFKGKWDDDKIDEVITMAKASKTVSSANDQEVKTPGKYSEVYEVHGVFSNLWLGEKMGDLDPNKHSPQVHIVNFYRDGDGNKKGICLFKGKEKKSIFKKVVLKPIFGRACGFSITESLFHETVWTNYDGIRLKELLDAAAIVLFQTADDEFGNQKIKSLKTNTVLKHSPGNPVTKMDSSVPNITAFTNDMIKRENNARVLGSASEGALGINPSSGTPFKLQDLVIQEGLGIHEYRQGKIATFMSDQLYRDWVLAYLVKDMNGGKKFSEDLSTEELMEIAETITNNEIEKRIRRTILESGKVPTNAERDIMRQTYKDDFMKKGTRRFFEILEGELDDIPVDVFVNIVGKQKRMAQNADKMTNIIRTIMVNPTVISQVPGLGKLFNQLIEDSGLNPIDFSMITKPPVQEEIKSPMAPVGDAKELAIA